MLELAGQVLFFSDYLILRPKFKKKLDTRATIVADLDGTRLNLAILRISPEANIARGNPDCMHVLCNFVNGLDGLI